MKIYETQIDDEEEFISFFDTNYTLFKDHLIVIQGELPKRIETYLKVKSLKYLHNIELPKGRSRKALEKELNAEKTELAVSQQITEAKLEKLSTQLQNI